MSNILALQPIVLARLNALPEHSRKRPGYVDILREIKRQEFVEDAKLTSLCVTALEEVFSDEDEAFIRRIRETW